MSFIMNLSRNHLLREVSFWVPLARIRGLLTQNATYGLTGGIGFNLDLALQVKVAEDWFFSKHLSQLGKNLPSVGG